MAAFRSDWCTEHTTTLSKHEVHFFLGDFFGSNDEVTLVFAIFIIDHNYKIAFAELLHGFFDSI